ncbi:MAG: 3-oxoacyl-ACP reductase [Lactobacillaceae bacterium]|jgi:3-oxoacyl-[acyl-carrier protein] reductase|nr:3-oxoacyl-ACP reductase [Lactobacillaceae bacterium]
MITQNYENQTVLITGAASGIGFAQTEVYLEAGAHVIGVDKAVIGLVHPQLETVQIDLADQNAVEIWLNSTDLSNVDVFLSTAGVLDEYMPALKTDFNAMKKIMAVNVDAPVQITLAILGSMIQHGHGEIVYMASIAGQVAGGGGAAYTMSKHALVGWMRQLALDYADENIHINAIAPGAINTAMNSADFAGDGAMAKEVAQQTPIHRWANADEVANLTLYLTSPEASYVQGQMLTIDGGWTIK